MWYRRSIALLCTLAPLCSAGFAGAQAYPTKLMRIVTAATGSANDWGSRVLAQELTAAMGQQVIVENRGGLAVEYTTKQPPDGYTLMFYGNTVWLLPFLRDNVGYDPLRDFAPVSMLAAGAQTLVVNPSLPVRNVKELVALAKSKPGAINFASSGYGGPMHLAGELLDDMATVGKLGAGNLVAALDGGLSAPR